MSSQDPEGSTDPSQASTGPVPGASRPESPRQSSGNKPSLLQQAVRFASSVSEISPTTVHQTAPSQDDTQDAKMSEDLSPEQKEEIRNLAMNAQKSRLQEHRMKNFAFEPVSLPPSQAPSRETSPHGSHRRSVVYGSSRASPSSSTVHSPPLTPAGSQSRDAQDNERSKRRSDVAAITPQTSPPHAGVQASPSGSRPSSSSGHISTQPTSLSDSASHPQNEPKKIPRFQVGPSGESSSTERSPAPTPPASSPRMTPAQQKLAQLDPRFAEPGEPRKQAVRSQIVAGTLPIPKDLGEPGAKESKSEKRLSAIFGSKKENHGQAAHDASSSSLDTQKHHGSMHELKRFFRLGGHRKSKLSESKGSSPAPVSRKSSSKSGIATPPKPQTPTHVPFSDEHGLEARYGKFGKVLGSGAGGSVRLLKRSSDGTTFAVKQFRDRHNWESEKDYAKKVTAEFCIGSTLHHGNIIETLDIIQENGRWYEVMEYAPFDLFAIVMTGKMSREEVACSFIQIVNGVHYLHSMGLAHRDLKLDNVVVNEFGIMKLIDFGSATVFRYPYDNDLVLASGIVGSDPYLAPEVYDERKYDPQPTDIWSLAIIFCCMTLRRFPWKQPRVIDNSYKLFVSTPTPGTPVPGAEPATQETNGNDNERGGSSTNGRHTHSHSHHNGDQSGNRNPTTTTTTTTTDAGKQEVIKGPWRLLRILPRESRHIIGRMLRVNPKERATMEELISDDWVKSTPVCSQTEPGCVNRAPGHEHTLEPSNAGSAPPSKK